MIQPRQEINLSDSNDYPTFFANSIQDPDIAIKAKVEILDFASTDVNSSIINAVARSAHQLLKALSNDGTEDTVQFASNLIDVYTAANGLNNYRFTNSSDYTSDVLDLYKKFPGVNIINSSVARYLLKANKEQAAALIKNIRDADDPRIIYAIKISELRFSDEFKLDEKYLTDLTKKSADVSFGDGNRTVTLRDLIESLSYIENDNKNFWPFISLVASTLRQAGTSISYSVNFRSGEPVALIGQNGSGFIFTLDQINKVTKKVSDAFLDKTNVFADSTQDLMQTLDFWTIKPQREGGTASATTDKEIISYYIYDGSEGLLDEGGSKIGEGRIGGRLVLFTTLSTPNVTQIGVSWRDANGEIVTKYANQIKGLTRNNLHLKGVPRLLSYYDEL